MRDFPLNPGNFLVFSWLFVYPILGTLIYDLYCIHFWVYTPGADEFISFIAVMITTYSA